MIRVAGSLALEDGFAADRAVSLLLFQLGSQVPTAQRRGPLSSLPGQQTRAILRVALVSLPQLGVAMRFTSSLLVFFASRASRFDATSAQDIIRLLFQP